MNESEAIKKTDQIRKIFESVGGNSFSGTAELAVLFELARGVGHMEATSGYCLDLGTYYGLSALVMAQAVKESRTETLPVLTVDAYPIDRGILENSNILSPIMYSDYFADNDVERDWIKTHGLRPITARATAYKLGLEDYMIQVIHDSIKFLQLFKLPIRLAFIDSSHDYTTCLNEVALVKRLLVPGGVIVFHDREFEQVSKVIKHFCEDDGHEILDRLAIWYPG